MSRPTPEDVDEAMSASANGVEWLLAAEVRMLRNELEYERNLRAALERQIRQLTGQLEMDREVLP